MIETKVNICTIFRLIDKSMSRLLKRWVFGIVLTVQLFLIVPAIAYADGPDPSHEFWLRFNNVNDAGKNFLEGTARGEGA